MEKSSASAPKVHEHAQTAMLHVFERIVAKEKSLLLWLEAG